MNTPIIKTKNLSKNFGKVQALKNVTLEIPKGSIFGLLGPNGAGKTTMIRLLLGLLEPSSGNAEVMGYNISSQSDKIRQRTGVLLENTGLYNHLRVYDNLEFYGRIWQIPKNERILRIIELLKQFNIFDKGGDITETLSKGMKQKLAIARAFLHKPQLVFLDEPSSGLDPISVISLRNYLSDVSHHQNCTIFLNTHNLNEAELLCDYIGIINNGELLKVDKTDALCKSKEMLVNIKVNKFNKMINDSLSSSEEITIKKENETTAVITLRNNKNLNDVINTIVTNGGEVSDVIKDKRNLEDVFIEYIQAG